MKQHQRRLVLLVGSSALTFLGVLAACSSDATMPLPGGDTFTNPDSGKTTTSSSGTSGSTGDDDDSGVTDAGGADCSAAPRLHPTTQGFFCPHFKDGGGADSGSTSNCPTDETCCNPGKGSGSSYPPSYCAPGTKGDNGNDNCSAAAADNGSTWNTAGSFTWECTGSSNCGGQKCCAYSLPGADAGNYVNVGKETGTGAPPAGCGAQQLYKVGGTKCAADCAAGSELELCSSTDDCSDTSATCTPTTTNSAVTGYLEVGVCLKPKTH